MTFKYILQSKIMVKMFFPSCSCNVIACSRIDSKSSKVNRYKWHFTSFEYFIYNIIFGHWAWGECQLIQSQKAKVQVKSRVTGVEVKVELQVHSLLLRELHQTAKVTYLTDQTTM